MIIGLTGTIASGKSESAKIFANLGAYCIDADKISRKLSAKGTPALKEISKTFGKEVLKKDGTLNRKKLAGIIFANKAAKNKLEKILHAKIIAEIKAIAFKKVKTRIVVINAPLLFETGLNKICDITAVVWSPCDVLEKRLAKRDGLNKKQIYERIASQLSFEKKAEKADFIIDNCGAKAQLVKNVAALYFLLTKIKQ
ncbi:dephospho-CoA kinase [Endomicrobium proavitum]|uniref:Dephospho-CoA kinase n=1 Tax=Endomicrobium proavitum TaxID=1408281 RepID=A0A0G3WIC9_9BACT|nr:dephospho-CoA kinase [Endomicrobium proavitum]AKL98048.1 Dephospho-CoA kinase [Endomicrobium proavitum]